MIGWEKDLRAGPGALFDRFQILHRLFQASLAEGSQDRLGVHERLAFKRFDVGSAARPKITPGLFLKAGADGLEMDVIAHLGQIVRFVDEERFVASPEYVADHVVLFVEML